MRWPVILHSFFCFSAFCNRRLNFVSCRVMRYLDLIWNDPRCHERWVRTWVHATIQSLAASAVVKTDVILVKHKGQIDTNYSQVQPARRRRFVGVANTASRSSIGDLQYYCCDTSGAPRTVLQSDYDSYTGHAPFIGNCSLLMYGQFCEISDSDRFAIAEIILKVTQGHPYDFLLVFYNVSILCRFRYMITLWINSLGDHVWP